MGFGGKRTERDRFNDEVDSKRTAGELPRIANQFSQDLRGSGASGQLAQPTGIRNRRCQGRGGNEAHASGDKRQLDSITFCKFCADHFTLAWRPLRPPRHDLQLRSDQALISQLLSDYSVKAVDSANSLHVSSSCLTSFSFASTLLTQSAPN